MLVEWWVLVTVDALEGFWALECVVLQHGVGEGTCGDDEDASSRCEVLFAEDAVGLGDFFVGEHSGQNVQGKFSVWEANARASSKEFV